MTKYTVTHDSATVREYEVEAETPDQAVEFVKEGKAKLVDSSSAETHRAREPRAMGAGAILGAGISGAFRAATLNMNTDKYANMAWTADDIQTLAPKLSPGEAEDWLKQNEKHIRDRLTEKGWNVISNLLACDGIDTSDPDES